MNILNLFRRKKEFDFDEITKDDSYNANAPAAFGSQTIREPFDPTPQSPGPAYASYDRNYSQGNSSTDLAMIRKDLEVISSKLDSLKAILESQSQRIYQVERTVYQGDRRW